MGTRVSIAMIVRDEADMAPGFLEAARGAWDELVVVDTGSTDGTAALFQAAGARVSSSPWSHDFAAARNASLALCTGDWVLVLDADERLGRGFAEEFRRLAEDPTVGAIAVRMSNPLPYGHRRDAVLLRAFRRDPGIVYRHAIHEDASESVSAMLLARKLRLAEVSTPIEHLGYVRSRAAAKDKKSRDQVLLSRAVEHDPQDFYSRLKLLELARYWRDSDLWKREAVATLDALHLAGPRALEGRPWAGELLALLTEGLFSADNPVALELLDAWEPRVHPAPAFFYRRGELHEALGHAALARADFERCLAFADVVGDRQLTTARPALALARLAIVAGDLGAAHQHASRALGWAPRDPEALTAVAALTRHLEGMAGLERWAREHATLEPWCPEREWAIGEALLTTGDPSSAVPWLRRASGVPPAGPASVRLAQALLASGNVEGSEQLARDLVPREPEAGLGVLLFNLARGEDTDLALELTQAGADAALHHWVDALLASGHQGLVQGLRRNAAVLGALFPWVPSYLERRTVG